MANVTNSTQKLFDDYFISKNQFGQYSCVYCIFSTRTKLQWLKHLKKKHRKEFDELVDERQHYRSVLDEALKKISDDDDDDDFMDNRFSSENNIESETNSDPSDQSKDEQAAVALNVEELTNKFKAGLLTYQEYLTALKNLIEQAP